MKQTVLSSQSIFDLAVQELGSVEAAFELALLNDLSLTDNLTAGQMLELSDKQNRAVADYYAANGLKPATGLTEERINAITNGGEGVEFWGIEYDFIVN